MFELSRILSKMMLMTKTKKRILFYIFAVLFIVVTCVAILYAQGYKYDFKNARFVNTGALGLKINTSADVYIDDIYVGSTSLFGTSFRKDGMLPNTYTVKVQKDNHSSWTKKIIIVEGLVTDFSHVMLLPLEGEDNKQLRLEIQADLREYSANALEIQRLVKFKDMVTVGDLSDYYYDDGKLLKITTADGIMNILAIADNVSSFELSPDKDKIVWWNNHELYVYWRKNEYYYNHLIGTSELLSRFSESIMSAGWFRDSDHILVNIGANTNKLLEIDSRGGMNIISL
jgi:hypothetical protein